MPQPPIRLSAVIITLNEEQNIRRCLESIKELADEIIVVDSFSTDRTEEICMEYGVRFEKRAWMGYSAQKNFANAFAQHDYILSIDADEALSPALIQSIKTLKTNPHSDAYSFSRLTNYCGQWIHHCGWYPDKKIRIWKTDLAGWKGDVHEKLVLEPGCSITELEGDLWHFTFYSIKQHLNQINLYTELIATEALTKGKRISMFQLICSPLVKFVKSYVFQRGFMDGYYGFIVCYTSAQASFYKYLKIRELTKARLEKI